MTFKAMGINAGFEKLEGEVYNYEIRGKIVCGCLEAAGSA